MVRFEDIKIGDAIPAIIKPAISHLQLALYAGAGADHNPIHVDEEAAKAGGLPGSNTGRRLVPNSRRP